MLQWNAFCPGSETTSIWLGLGCAELVDVKSLYVLQIFQFCECAAAGLHAHTCLLQQGIAQLVIALPTILALSLAIETVDLTSGSSRQPDKAPKTDNGDGSYSTLQQGT